MHWTHGYHAADGYTYGYFVEASPKRIAWAAALKGVRVESERFRYLDLGCGQGFGLIINAACHPESEFVGIDFMPDHIAHAQSLAKTAGITNVRFYEIDFLEADQHLTELGEFDYVIAHGISSWISPVIRQAMIKLAASALKPAGIFYNSYNAMPGWLSMMPFQQLTAYLKKQGKRKDYFAEAIELTEKLNNVTGTLGKFFPDLPKKLEKIKSNDSAYLLHEYGNEFWEPLSSMDMIHVSRKYKLDFLCTATLPEIQDGAYPAKLRELINEQDSLEGKELIKDFALHQTFRRDLYIKGKPSDWIQPLERFSGLRLCQSNMSPIPENSPFEIKGAGIAINGSYEVYTAVLNKFSDAPKTLGEVAAQLPKTKPVDLAGIVTNLISGGWLVFYQDVDCKPAERLNRCIANAVLSGAPYQFLAMPKFSQGYALRDTEVMCFGLSLETNDPKSIASSLMVHMQTIGKHFVRDGSAITSQKDALKIAETMIESYLKKRLPLLITGGALKGC